MTHLVILMKVTTGKFYMSINKNLSSTGWHVDYVYRFIDKLCTCAVDHKSFKQELQEKI